VASGGRGRGPVSRNGSESSKQMREGGERGKPEYDGRYTRTKSTGARAKKDGSTKEHPQDEQPHNDEAQQATGDTREASPDGPEPRPSRPATASPASDAKAAAQEQGGTKKRTRDQADLPRRGTATDGRQTHKGNRPRRRRSETELTATTKRSKRREDRHTEQ